MVFMVCPTGGNAGLTAEIVLRVGHSVAHWYHAFALGPADCLPFSIQAHGHISQETAHHCSNYTHHNQWTSEHTYNHAPNHCSPLYWRGISCRLDLAGTTAAMTARRGGHLSVADYIKWKSVFVRDSLELIRPVRNTIDIRDLIAPKEIMLAKESSSRIHAEPEQPSKVL